MKVSKETKILAIVLTLFLLIGIGCGAAVATSGHSGQQVHGWNVQFDTAELTAAEYYASAENGVPATLPGITLFTTQATESGAAKDLDADIGTPINSVVLPFNPIAITGESIASPAAE